MTGKEKKNQKPGRVKVSDMSKRVFWIVLDSAGIGGAPDAAEFGDKGADTFGTCYKSGKLKVPFMEKMGLRNIASAGCTRNRAARTRR